MLSLKLIAIGIGVGSSIGLMTNEMVLWVGIGVSVGLALDISRVFKTKSATPQKK